MIIDFFAEPDFTQYDGSRQIVLAGKIHLMVTPDGLVVYEGGNFFMSKNLCSEKHRPLIFYVLDD